MVTSGETGNRMLPTLVTQLDKDPWLYQMNPKEMYGNTDRCDFMILKSHKFMS